MNDESHVNDPDALLNAAYDGNYDLVEKLLSQGADINACNNQKETALFIAVDEGYSGVVELLLERGADPKLSDENGDTALDIARYHGYKEIENILLSYGALGKDGPSAREKMWDGTYEGMDEANKIKFGSYSGDKLLEAAKHGDFNLCKHIISLPVEEGGLILLRFLGKDNLGNTALHLASKNGHIEIVKLLLDNGVGTDSRNELGKTPKELATNNGHKDIVDLFDAYRKSI